jgi:hypothetical protein
MNDEYRQRAELHAPKTTVEIERAARELAARGLGDHTVAHVLHMDVNALRRMLGAPATAAHAG